MIKQVRIVLIYLLFISLLPLFSCSSVPFKVQPRVEVAPASIAGLAAGKNIDLRAQLLAEDEIVHLFDGNLLLAGIIPVRVAITNHSEQRQFISQSEFQLSDQSGRRFSLVKAK